MTRPTSVLLTAGPIQMTSNSISEFFSQENFNRDMRSLGSSIDNIGLEGKMKAAAIAYRFNVLNAAEIMLCSFFSGNKSLLREKFSEELRRNDHKDINAQNISGDTPLHIAACQANQNSIQMLIDANANVNILNRDGKAARDCVPSGETKCFEILDELMKSSPVVPSPTSAAAPN
jgi:ankyrin repeat protein